MSRSGDEGVQYKPVGEHQQTPFAYGKSASTSEGNSPPGSPPPPTQVHLAVAGKRGMGLMFEGKPKGDEGEYEYGEHEYGEPEVRLCDVAKTPDKPEMCKRCMSNPSEASDTKQKARFGSQLDSGRSEGTASTFDLQDAAGGSDWGGFDDLKDSDLSAQKAPGTEAQAPQGKDLIGIKKMLGWDDAKEEAKSIKSED
jgi:hypothetical protein